MLLQKLKKCSIKIKASKCQLFKRESSYLGRAVSADGCTIDSKNVDAVLVKLKKNPNNITELRSLLGLVGSFPRTIPNFSQLARPLYVMLENSDLTSRFKQLINWTGQHQSSIDNPLIYVTSPPILAISDFQLPLILPFIRTLQPKT